MYLVDIYDSMEQCGNTFARETFAVALTSSMWAIANGHDFIDIRTLDGVQLFTIVFTLSPVPHSDDYEVTIHPALADAIVAEQNSLTDEDIQTVAITTSAVLRLLAGPHWDRQAIVDFYGYMLKGTGENTSHELNIRLLKVQKKLFNQKVVELDKKHLVL